MKLPKQDPLLKAVLGGDDLQAFRQATLECGLVAVRRRRLRRRITGVCTLVCLPLLAALVILFLKQPVMSERVTTARAPTPTDAPPPTRNTPVRTITDDELFAMFPDRPLALVGKPGHQQLVFLDQPKQQSVKP